MLACVSLAAAAASAFAQDSTALATGGSDALSAYDLGVQRVRYVVDLAPLTGSWGSGYLVGPILKAPAEIDPLFRTQMLGSTALSAEQAADVAVAPISFSRWSAPGVGVSPSANTAPNPADSVTVSGFSDRFAVGVTGVSAGATNIISAVIGRRAEEPARVYVERVTAISSRSAALAPDTCTLTLGGIASDGVAILRADDATAKSPVSLRRDNLLRVASASRNPAAVASLSWPANDLPTSTDPAAVFLAYNLGVSVTVPGLLPGSPARALSMDFASRFLVDALEKAGATAPGLFALRGNPSFAAVTAAPGWPASAGFVACFARAAADAPTSALNVFAVDAAGTPVGTARSAFVPAPLTGAGGFAINNSGEAQFRQYRNQTLFRGPAWHVGVGFDPPTSAVALAAVLTDAPAQTGGPPGAEAMVVCRMTAPEPSWEVVARVGTPVLSGANGSGAPVGTIAANQPVVFSAPAMDRLGNVYFVAAMQPSGAGAVQQALVKAVRTPTAPSGFALERLLHSGQSFTGPNSTRPWSITRLRLADSDSIDSGGFHGGSVLARASGDTSPTGPADASAFGGCVVNAVITYDAGTAAAQTYEATLLILPAPPVCAADLNGDGSANTVDLVLFLGRFGQTVTPGAPGDLNGDGAVNTLDLTRFLSGFGCGG